MGKALAEKVVALRWAIVAAWIAAAAALAVFVPAPDPAANELQTFLPQESPSVQASAALARHFPRSAGLSRAVIVIERRLGHGPDARAAKLTGADLDGLDGLARRLRESLPEAFAKELPGSRLSVRSPGDFRLLARANPLVSADGASAIAVVHIPAAFTTIRSARVVEHIRRMAAEISFPEGLDVAVTGSAGFGADYAEATKRSHRNTLWVTLLAVTVILLAVYRAPLAAWTVLATISLAALVAHFGLHIAAHAGLHVGTGERIFVFVLLYGVGVDYSLLYLSRFREYLASSPQPAAAAVQALSATAPAILASSGTDIAGLAMLSAAAFEIFRTTGKVVPLALLVAAAATLTLVPAAAAIAGRRLFWPSRQVGHIGSRRLWPVVARVVTGRPGIVLAVAAIVLAIPASRAVRLNFVYDTLTGLSADYGAVRGREMARRHWPVGQASPTIVLLQAESGSAGKGLAALSEQLTEKLAQVEGVADVRSLQKPLGRRGKDIATELLLLAAAEQVRAEYLSGDARAARLEVVLTDPGFSNAAMATLLRVRQGCAEALPSGVSAHFAGATAEMADIRAVTQQDFYRVAGLVLAVVFVIVLVLLRDAVLSAFMVASVVLSYLAALGVSWWFFTGVCGAEGLDWKVEVFLFVVMLAVGVDYNIFLAARLAEESQRADIREAARMAIVKTGGIISSAGLIMAATLGSLMAGEISLLVQLGFAFAVGMLLDTFIVRPLLLPAFAVVTGRGGRGMLPGR